MEMQTVSAEKLFQQRQNEFIEKRTIIEREIGAWLDSMNALDPSFQERCGYDYQGKTVKELLSAAWEDDFDEAKYSQQLAEVKERIQRSIDLADKLNGEALACLQNA